MTPPGACKLAPMHRLTALVLFLLTLTPATHAGTVILTPDPGYLATTTLVTFSDPDEALLSAVTASPLTITFSNLFRASTVGNNWATWAAPPDTESATPRVLWSGLDDNTFFPITTSTLDFSLPVSLFGFELQPGPTDQHTVTASFFNGVTLLQSISRDLLGDSGARLFAYSAGPGESITSVVINSDADWAIGQLRFQEAEPVPEPATAALTAAALSLLSIHFRKRK